MYTENQFYKKKLTIVILAKNIFVFLHVSKKHEVVLDF